MPAASQAGRAARDRRARTLYSGSLMRCWQGRLGAQSRRMSLSYFSRVRIGVSESEREATRTLVQRAPHGTIQIANKLGWACDARVLLGAGAIWWLGSPRGRRSDPLRYLAVIATTTALHHAIKRVVAQQRPDRALRVKGKVKPTGRPGDAFPSGHAMHAGALASFVSSNATRLRAWPWGIFGSLAFARVPALAHWPSGVLGGFAIGVLVDKAWRHVWRDPRL